MHTEGESNALNYQLFFFGATATYYFKLRRHSLHVLHCQFYRSQLDLGRCTHTIVSVQVITFIFLVGINL